MKYQNTRLTEKISLVKYDGNNCLHQERVELLESDLRDWVIHGPEIFSERSTCQPYLVFEEECCKGAVLLALSCDEKTLEISAQFIEETFPKEENMILFCDRLIRALESHISQDYFEMKVWNNFDLPKYFSNRYQEIFLSSYPKTFLYANQKQEEKAHSLMKKLSPKIKRQAR